MPARRVVRELLLHVQLGGHPEAEADGGAELCDAGDAHAGPEAGAVATAGPPGERAGGECGARELQDLRGCQSSTVGGCDGGAEKPAQAEIDCRAEERSPWGGLLHVDGSRLRDLLEIRAVDLDGFGLFLKMSEGELQVEGA